VNPKVAAEQGELTFTRDVNGPLGPTWTLTGPLGAVVFSPTGIDFHLPKPIYTEQDEPHSDNCPTTQGRCWADGSSLAGPKLQDRWERAGRDDSVIRAELEDWYADLASAGDVRADRWQS
jgi:hypothetical protein